MEEKNKFEKPSTEGHECEGKEVTANSWLVFTLLATYSAPNMSFMTCLYFLHRLNYKTKCCSCSQSNQSETTQMYVEMPVPPDKSRLNDHVEMFLNTS